jgi:hypothetical protein
MRAAIESGIPSFSWTGGMRTAVNDPNKSWAKWAKVITSVPQILYFSGAPVCVLSSEIGGGCWVLASEPFSLIGAVRPPLDIDVVGVSVK